MAGAPLLRTLCATMRSTRPAQGVYTGCTQGWGVQGGCIRACTRLWHRFYCFKRPEPTFTPLWHRFHTFTVFLHRFPHLLHRFTLFLLFYSPAHAV